MVKSTFLCVCPQTTYDCAAGSVLVSLIENDWKFNSPDAMQCAPVKGPYVIDTSDCQGVPVTDAAAQQTCVSRTDV